MLLPNAFKRIFNNSLKSAKKSQAILAEAVIENQRNLARLRKAHGEQESIVIYLEGMLALNEFEPLLKSDED